ncbi:MAG: archaemetzincin family Zn-dependent metalloprotease [Nitrososphaeria archaeon]
MNKEVVYLPLGSSWRVQLYFEELVKAASIYGLKARTVNVSFPLDADSFDSSRGQFDALTLLDYVGRLKIGDSFYMGVTAADIFVPEMNFIFGIADKELGCAILSVARLIYAQYEASSNTLKERVLKEAAHELGHLLGLGHCSDRECLMSYSNSLAEVDSKKPSLCPRCRSMLKVLRLKC